MQDYKFRFVSQKFVNEYNTISQQWIEKAYELGVITVPNGIVHPHRPTGVIDHSMPPSLGGVTDENLNYIPDSEQIVIARCYYNEPQIEMSGFDNRYDFNEIEYIDEPVIYIGLITDHWGHFIHENIARLWYFIDNPDCNYKIAYLSSYNDSLFEYIYLLGLSPDRFIRINRPIKFKEVIMPEVSMVLSDIYHKKYAQIIEKMGENILPLDHKKIYLTRSLWRDRERVIGEKEIVNTFRNNGFTIVSPERLSARDKISLMKGADIVVTLRGSAAYNMLFGKSGAKLIVLNTATSGILQLVEVFRKDIEVIHVDIVKELLPVHVGIGPSLLTLTPQLEDFFNCFDIKYNKENFTKNLLLDSLDFYKSWIVRYSQEYNASILREFNPGINIPAITKEIIDSFSVASPQ